MRFIFEIERALVHKKWVAFLFFYYNPSELKFSKKSKILNFFDLWVKILKEILKEFGKQYFSKKCKILKWNFLKNLSILRSWKVIWDVFFLFSTSYWWSETIFKKNPLKTKKTIFPEFSVNFQVFKIVSKFRVRSSKIV